MNLKGWLPSPVVKLQPVLVGIAPVLALVVMFAAFIQPRMKAGTAVRARLEPLQQRFVSLQTTLATRATTEGSVPDVLTEFERRIPADDRAPELLERLTQLALAGTDKEHVQNLTIETGARVTASVAVGDGTAPAGAAAERLDPRLELFPTPLSYTPITIGFDSSYEQLGRFLWQLHGLPTLVEIRSVEIGPAGVPSLVHVSLVVVAFQRREPEGNSQSAVASAGFVTSGLANPATAVATGGVTIPAPPRVDFGTPPTWARNPFAAIHATSEEAPAPPVADPVVRSILYAAQRRAAFVDSSIVGVGDRVGAGRVVAIERDAIIVETPAGERRRFALRGPGSAGGRP